MNVLQKPIGATSEREMTSFNDFFSWELGSQERKSRNKFDWPFFIFFFPVQSVWQSGRNNINDGCVALRSIYIAAISVNEQQW